jgi:hypothetical protein
MKPVAWQVAEMVFDTEEAAIATAKTYDDAIIPLYTHPVKELTDEEILKLYVNNSTYDNDQKLFIDIYGFARAILRKAQENG